MATLDKNLEPITPITFNLQLTIRQLEFLHSCYKRYIHAEDLKGGDDTYARWLICHQNVCYQHRGTYNELFYIGRANNLIDRSIFPMEEGHLDVDVNTEEATFIIEAVHTSCHLVFNQYGYIVTTDYSAYAKCVLLKLADTTDYVKKPCIALTLQEFIELAPNEDNIKKLVYGEISTNDKIMNKHKFFEGAKPVNLVHLTHNQIEWLDSLVCKFNTTRHGCINRYFFKDEFYIHPDTGDRCFNSQYDALFNFTEPMITKIINLIVNIGKLEESINQWRELHHKERVNIDVHWSDAFNVVIFTMRVMGLPKGDPRREWHYSMSLQKFIDEADASMN